MKYLVRETNEVFEDINSVLDYCIDDDYHDRNDDYFEEWINETYEDVHIGGYTYRPYDVLEAMGDLDDFEDSYSESESDNDRDNAYWELKNGSVGEVTYCQRYSIEIIEEESGDYDGDEDIDYVEKTRQYYDEQTCLMKNQEEEEKKNEKDLMTLFQRIGA